MLFDLINQAREELQAMRRPRGNWGYNVGGTPAVEPSVLAALALMATDVEDTAARDFASPRATADWLASVQHRDGSLPVAEDIGSAGWTTPYALLLWHAVPGFEQARRAARAWLLALQGKTLPREETIAGVIGHDATAHGWPWVENTHSWVEPTALATLALCRLGLKDHGRVKSGIALILDRSLSSGGWNYGNPAVLGRDLRAQPGPSGIALLALAAHGNDSPECRRGIDYLRRTLPLVRSGSSLGWGVLGLRAWDACPDEAANWLACSHARHRARAGGVIDLALSLLAASGRGLALLIEPKESAARNSPAR